MVCILREEYELGGDYRLESLGFFDSVEAFKVQEAGKRLGYHDIGYRHLEVDAIEKDGKLYIGLESLNNAKDIFEGRDQMI